MKVLASLALMVAPLTMGLSSVASAQVNPGQVYIEGLTYNGSGCPLGTVAENLSSDRQAFTLTFSDYFAEAGPYAGPRDGRKNCQVTLDLKVPQGFQFSIATFDYRGFVDLDRGIQARQSASYYFQGQGGTGRFGTTMKGPLVEDYTFRDTIGLASVVWSPCGESRALNINTSVSVSNRNRRQYPDAQGLITNDSIDGAITHKYGLVWRRCR